MLPLRVAIAQRNMHWSIAENVDSAIDAINLAGANEANVCIFPELSVTGFHRKIRTLCDLWAASTAPWLTSVAPAGRRLWRVCRRPDVT